MPHFPRRLLVAAALGGSAVLAAAGPALAATPGTDAAATWLSGALTDGNHIVIGGFAYDGTSADALFALVAAGGHDDTVAAIDTYLQGDVANYADPAATTGGPYSGGVAKLALTAEIARQDPHAYGGFDLLKVLTDNECTAPTMDGTCNAPGEFYQSFSTISQAIGVIALQRSPVDADHLTAASAPVTRLLALRCTDGLFTGELLAPGDTCAKGDVDSSAYAAQALGAVLGADDPAVTTTLDALVAAQDPSGGFQGAAGLNTNSAGVVLSAFSLQPTTYAAATEKAAAFVENLQQSAGFYAVSADDKTDESGLQATGQALLGVLGRNLADPTLVLAPPVVVTTPPTAPSGAGSSAAPIATASTPELAATGVSNGQLRNELVLALAALVGGGALVRLGARRLPHARHRS